jgi:hypothetical protein
MRLFSPSWAIIALVGFAIGPDAAMGQALRLPQAPEKPPDTATVALPAPVTILQQGEYPIELNTALRLAGVQNPELLLSRQRISEATAVRQMAAA